ncbi:MAG: hypothetical protein Q9219_000123 [cf. Caloplaca sp. 3 TL-2023]
MEGQITEHSYTPGYIVLSYFVSFVGCWTSLKLLHRRTARHGYYNWYLLLGAAISMGAVAIWSMHFIGNRAITMGRGENRLQIQYNAAYTVGSFLLPICVLIIAFYLLGLSEGVKITRIAIVGVLTGAAICGMHYFGQGGISNYEVSYQWEYVLGAALIAISAATIALGVFFYLKATWTNNWWKRGLCASLLAAAVSGMHWVAAVGTVYRHRPGTRRSNGLTRQATVVVVLCFAIGCCIVLFVFAVIGHRVKTRSAHRAQQVVLASVVFDTEGKLMVTPEGRLPSRKIAKTFMERAKLTVARQNFDDMFDTDHPVYAWVYRASRYWPGVVDLIPGMKAHLGSMKSKLSDQAELNDVHDDMHPDQPRINTLEEEADFDTNFKELFCVAASELADSTQQPLEDVGVLYDSIMLTGTVDKPRRLRVLSKYVPNDTWSTLEQGQANTSFGRGQLLFLVRLANKRDASRLQAAGFSFATLTYIVPSLAQSLEVTTGELSVQLHQIQRSLSGTSMLESGVHIACFALRPRFQHGWTVLVNKDQKNLLPSVQLATEDLQPWQTDILTELDNMTPRQCLLHLERRNYSAPMEIKNFMSVIGQAIGTLVTQIDHPLFENARFFAHPYSVPCQNAHGTPGRRKASVVVFRVIVDAHSSIPLNGPFEFGSARLFRAQQHVYPRSPDHGAFARQVHLEFAGLRGARAGTKPTSLTGSGPSTPRRSSDASKTSSPDGSIVKPAETYTPPRKDEAKVSRIVSVFKKPAQNPKARALFGGIHVQRDISIDVNEVQQHQESGSGVELGDLGVHSEVTVAPTEIDTFADELMLLLMEERRRASLRSRNL